MKSLMIRGSILLTLFLYCNCAYTQQIDFRSDILAINKNLSLPPADPYKRPYIYKNEPSLVQKINPVNIIFGASLYVYQNVISRQLSTTCLYSPSCSEFSKEAVIEFGLLKGAILSVDRVTRCGALSSFDLKNTIKDPDTDLYPDPVSKYKRKTACEGH